MNRAGPKSAENEISIKLSLLQLQKKKKDERDKKNQFTQNSM